jgi:hypothetical protein
MISHVNPALKALIGSISGSDWISAFERLFTNSTPTISGKDLDTLLENAKDCLQKRQIGRARNWLALAFRLSEPRTLERVRRGGLLRASKYDYDSERVSQLVSSLLERKTTIGLSDATTTYLGSVSAVLHLGPAVLKLRHSIVALLRSRKAIALKALVAVVDLRFLLPHTGARDCTSESPAFYTLEDYAEALSLIVHLFEAFVGIRDSYFNQMDEEGVLAGDYDRCLIAACKIKRFEDAELLIDAFLYEATLEGSSVRITARDTRLEQSIRLGYIQVQMQDVARQAGQRSDPRFQGLPSLSALIQQFVQDDPNVWTLQVESPIPRIVLRLPMVPPLFSMFRDDGLYVEDVVYLEQTAKEQYCRPDELLRYEIAPELKVLDVIKIQRFVTFLCTLMGARLRPLFDVQAPMAYRSLLPVFESSQFLKLLEQVVSADAAKQFLQCAQYRGQNHPRKFDIQYAPIIRANRSLLIPVNILGMSNLLRNLLYVYAPGRKARDPDPRVGMQELLAQALTTRFDRIAQNTEITLSGEDIEIDILVLVGRTLLVIECKSPYHPCDLHELRTSFDHVVKASNQLDRILRLLGDSQNMQRLWQKLGWNGIEHDSVVTCIVTANRMFNGHRLNGASVRQAYEMVNLLETGEVHTGDSTLRLWRNTEFSATDLLDYVAGKTIHQDIFDSMDERDLIYELGAGSLTFSTFSLNGNRLRDIVEARYPKVLPDLP